LGETDRRRGRLKKLAIAFYCWSRGYFTEAGSKELKALPSATCGSEKEGIPIWDHERKRMGIRIDRNKLPDYATADFWEAVRMWQDWKTFGFPEAGGVNDQPYLWLLIVRNMEAFSKEFCHGEA
jgi:hypothetical protein